MPGLALMRSSAACSRGCGAGSVEPFVTITRQVVQRARPPHTEACGTPLSRKVSSTLRRAGS